MGERYRPNLSNPNALRGGRVDVNPYKKSLVESVLESEGLQPKDMLTPKQIKTLRKAAQRQLPLGVSHTLK